ncbi:glycosyltransferase family 2 protein [Couchioplanes caeruleus]|uniref:Glycosyl transferase n=2 Tax=Couchioplanes caeruleus TaxID=56438 RepID=A0A1K0GBG0_9ACTN|nr:glycosyltransferase family 2 protein [Couchioplanes caeruleus]OJF09502.1 glycosyl transferase [Couchioplanes caeruleus subsp. caeruleus]ROP33773.1 glycosyl transferase family 2 [Couchioplanes caeruleus]
MPAVPDVTVVIPTRFRPDLVIRAVRSALAQTHPALEVIVVVDGPDDDTRDALAAVSDARLRVMVLAEKGGAPNARNVGARAATGSWTAYLDDDDEWLPEKVATQLALAATASVRTPIVASRLINRTPRADSVMPRRLPVPGEPLSEYLTVRRGLFYGDGFIQTSTIMAPTELFRRVPFTVGLRRQQELDWTLRALQQPGTELYFAAEPLVLWHQDENRDRISLHMPWEEQLEWLRRSRALFTPRAYAAFTMSVLGSMAATTRSRTVFREILAEARGHGRPRAIDYLTFLQIWLLPPGLRHRVRDVVLGRRRSADPVDVR